MTVFQVKKSEGGLSVLEFIQKHLNHPYSNKEIKRRIESNQCRLNGAIERIASKKVAWKDLIEWNEEHSEKPKKLTFEKEKILFEDADLLIYNKPSGITSDKEGILSLLSSYGKFILVHRLDKGTSGVLILAKNATSEKALLKAFKEREIEKSYVALVDGIPKVKKGLIENYLGKIGSIPGGSLYGSVKPAGGKIARTLWILQKSYKLGSLIAAFPETGRTHQIRVHLSEMGYPILGDFQYSKHFRCKITPPRLLLHAYQIKLKHPTQNTVITVKAPIPKDFQEMIKVL